MDNETVSSPIIIQSPDNPGPGTPRTWPRYIPTFLLFGLAMIVLVEIVLGVRTLMQPVPVSSIAKSRPVSGGQMALLAPAQEYKIGQTVQIKVKVSTGGHLSSGIDLLASYDPKLLQATGSSVVVPGDIFPTYPSPTIDPDKGQIALSGITDGSGKSLGFNGIGNFATLNLVAQTPGTTTVKLLAKPGMTDDSNIIDQPSASDILEKTTDLTITIKP